MSDHLHGDQGPGAGDRKTVPIPDPQSSIQTAADLEAAIDLVAREMTGVEGPAWLRTRVIEQIESPPALRWTGLRAWTWMSVAAVLVLAVAGSVWVWRPRQATEPVAIVASEGAADSGRRQPEASIAARSEIEASGDPRSGRDPIGRAGRSAGQRTIQAAHVPAATRAAFDPTDTDPWVIIEPIPEPDPIAIDPLSIAPVVITSLSIPELRIEPVDPWRDPAR
ncbi:MAG: hypothetical protein AB1806_11995 [Acidobacteriota bacterium]